MERKVFWKQFFSLAQEHIFWEITSEESTTQLQRPLQYLTNKRLNQKLRFFMHTPLTVTEKQAFVWVYFKMMKTTMKVVAKGFHHHQVNIICMEIEFKLYILIDSTYNLITYVSNQSYMIASEKKLQKKPATHNFLIHTVTWKSKALSPFL